MPAGRLPEEGEFRIGKVLLPAGRRAVPVYDSQKPVAWVTTRPVPDAGRVWSALSDAREQSGLVPVLLADDGADDAYFYSPSGISELGHLDAAAVLSCLWKDSVPTAEDEEFDRRPAADRPPAPFGREFPGLAPAGDSGLSKARRDEVLGSLPPARIGLVAASRPADVLPLIGWSPFGDYPFGDYEYPVSNAVWVAVVLRSWEDRYGATLLNIGPGAEIRLLVDRPPCSLEAAVRIAAEHYAFCDECGGRGLGHIPDIAGSLVKAPIWTFWWD
jgi:hypothetical protein